MEVLVERQCGLDVHKAQVTACVRVPGEDGGRAEAIAQFATTVPGPLALSDWLSAHAVTDIVMEATGDYWKPVWHLLGDDFRLIAGQRPPRQAGPRSQDRRLRYGLVVSPRRGRALVAELRAAKADPRSAPSDPLPPHPDRRAPPRGPTLHKALEDTGIKLGRVASDILGKSGRAMLDALVGGTTDPEILAELARGKMRRKIPALREALQGRFAPVHALLVGLDIALRDAALAAIRTNDSYLQALDRRKRIRLGHGRAIGAVEHAMLCAIWHVLATGEPHTDLGGDYFARRDPERQTRRLIAQLERLGHSVTLSDVPEAA